MGLDDLGAPVSPARLPWFVEVSFDGVQDQDGIHDYTLGDARASATLTVDVLDARLDPLCVVQFDLSSGAARPVDVPDWAPDAYAAFELSVGSGVTDCPALDPAIYGTSDMRDLLGALDWGVAWGSVDPIAELAQAALAARGVDWTVDWDGVSYGTFVTWDRTTADGLGVARIEASTCDTVDPTGPSYVPATPSPPTGRAVSVPVGTNALEDLTGVGCDLPRDDVGDPAVTTGPDAMDTVAYVTFDVDVGVGPGPELLDFWVDPDGDGTYGVAVGAHDRQGLERLARYS